MRGKAPASGSTASSANLTRSQLDRDTKEVIASRQSDPRNFKGIRRPDLIEKQREAIVDTAALHALKGLNAFPAFRGKGNAGDVFCRDIALSLMTSILCRNPPST